MNHIKKIAIFTLLILNKNISTTPYDDLVNLKLGQEHAYLKAKRDLQECLLGKHMGLKNDKQYPVACEKVLLVFAIIAGAKEANDIIQGFAENYKWENHKPTYE